MGHVLKRLRRLVPRVARDGNERNVPTAQHQRDRLRGFGAEVDIQYGRVTTRALDELQGFGHGGRRADDRQSGFGEVVAYLDGNERLILDDEHAPPGGGRWLRFAHAD